MLVEQMKLVFNLAYDQSKKLKKDQVFITIADDYAKDIIESIELQEKQ